MPGQRSHRHQRQAAGATGPPRRAALALLVLLGALAGCAKAELFGVRIWPPEPSGQAVSERFPDGAARRPDAATRSAQAMLAKLGYDPGAADGIAGPKTRDAVRHYQQDTGQEADGQVSPGLLDSLAASLRGGRAAPAARRPAVGAKPSYRPGSRFVYSDGRVETVVGLDGDKVRWRNNRGEAYTAHRNFVLPPAAWFSAAESRQSRAETDPWTLWPLEPGGAAEFTVRTAVRHGERPDDVSESVARWACRVEATERVSVVAGTFDALKVVCRRAAGDSGPRLTRAWYYAPRIGHYVRQTDVYDAEERDRHVELVAIQPGGQDWPPAARAGLGWALRHALESMSSDEQIEWSSSAVETRVTIKPSARFERGDGKSCRNYLQIWSEPDGRHSYPGTACREPSGRWRVPGLSDGPDDARGLIGRLE